MRGLCSVSQVSAGRKNRLTWELSGSERSLAWVSEEPEYLWVGHRGRPNEVAGKDPALMTAWAPPSPATRPATSRATRTPSAGCSPPSTPTSPPAGRRPSPTRPSPTADVMLVCDAVVESARSRTWAPVRRSAP